MSLFSKCNLFKKLNPPVTKKKCQIKEYINENVSNKRAASQQIPTTSKFRRFTIQKLNCLPWLDTEVDFMAFDKIQQQNSQSV